MSTILIAQEPRSVTLKLIEIEVCDRIYLLPLRVMHLNDPETRGCRDSGRDGTFGYMLKNEERIEP